MIVQMTINMSGGRHDGREWPPAWHDFEVPDWEGHDLVRGGLARFIRHGGSAPGPADESTVVSEPAQTAAGPLSTETHQPDWGTVEPQSEDEQRHPPKAVEPKQAWADYAVSLGEDAEHIATLTKAELMERYGSRA